MAAKGFLDFLNSNIKQNDRLADERRERLFKFKEDIADFYSHIENQWLAEFISEHKIQLSTKVITINEDRLGDYEVDEKQLTIGNKNIIFTPVGTYVLGTDARIDMTYRNARVMFVHVGENITSSGDLISSSINGKPKRPNKEPGRNVWKYVKNDMTRSLISVNDDTFQELIMAVINEEDRF